MDLLLSHLTLFFTGFPRNASEYAGELIKNTTLKRNELQEMMSLVDEALSTLNGNDANLLDFGKLLHETWKLKRELTPHVATPYIDEIYEAALAAGATGGKLLGAGGGGFMLFFARPELQDNIREKLGKLLHVPFAFENLGSQVIYYAPEDNY